MLYLTLRHYEYAVAIAQAGSLSGAASILNVSQPSLSNALTTIETRLGHRLFLRGRGQGLTITPQGRQFVAQAQNVLTAAGRLEHSGQDPVPHSEIVLGCFTDLAPFLLAPALSAIRVSLPDLHVRTRIGGFTGLIEGMMQGDIDICITWDIGLDARFGKTVLERWRPHVFLPNDHPLARKQTLGLAELAGSPLILSDDGLSINHMLRLCVAAGFTPTIAHRAASIEIMRAMAAHAQGIGLSYSAPPGAVSYDGMPLITLPVTDAHAAEPVVLVQLGDLPDKCSLMAVADAIRTAG